MKEIILGVDGGGTKTKIIASEYSGHILAEAIGYSINYNFIGMDNAIKNFINICNKLNLSKDTKITSVSIGNPAMDDEVHDIMADTFIECIKTYDLFDENTKYYMKSDAFMAFYGLTRGKEGVLIISGTGSMGVAIDKKGNLYTVGGWGFPTNDDGSGYYIAVEGLKAAFNYADGINPGGNLLQAALRFFNTNKARELIGILNNEKYLKADIAAFSKEVAKCAEKGDGESNMILDNAAKLLSLYAISLIRKIKSEHCTVGMYGGVFQNNEQVRNHFTRYINKDYPNINVQFPELMPEEAAVIYAINKRKDNIGR